MLYDPSIAYSYLQASVTVVPFVLENSSKLPTRLLSITTLTTISHPDVFPLDSLANLASLDASCGFSDFRDTYMTFPPPGPMPDLNNLPGRKNFQCLALFEEIYMEISTKNPCFDIYEVTATCPVLWDVMGCELL